MATEIERKFLVVDGAWRDTASRGATYRQGYLAATSRRTVRIRREARHATLTVKGPRIGIVRDEFTYDIPIADADQMLSRLCAGRVLTKTRHMVEHDGRIWHVDTYAGAAAGLVVAEIELDRADQPFSLPPWVGAEVTHERRYRNSEIARRVARAERQRKALAKPRAARRAPPVTDLGVEV